MNFLELGRHLDLYKINLETATVIFKINNLDSVKSFLDDDDLQKFLKNPETQDDNCGCRLKIERHGPLLMIQRESDENTLMQNAYTDLLSTLKTYIVPLGSDGDSAHPACIQWKALTHCLNQAPRHIATKTYARGISLIAREENEINFHHSPILR